MQKLLLNESKEKEIAVTRTGLIKRRDIKIIIDGVEEDEFAGKNK